MSKPPKIDMVRVDRTEYEALCELRDGAHERAKLEAVHAKEHYQQCLQINRDQVARLTAQDLRIKELEGRLAAYVRENDRLAKENESLRPPTLNVGSQPALRPKSLSGNG